MKVLIFQVSINGGAYVYGAPLPPFEQKLIPSVKRYCKKYGYDYKMITKKPETPDLSWFNKKAGPKDRASTLVRYLHMNQPKYDMIVSLDCDIFIPKHAESLPEVNGHAGVVDRGKKYGKTFVNGGVQMMDRESGALLSQFVRSKIEKQKFPRGCRGSCSDQFYIKEWRNVNSDRAKFVDYKWNYLTGELKPNQRNYKEACFIHYAGKKGRAVFEKDLKGGYFESN